MTNYGRILEYLAKNPPKLAAERQVHATLLELLAHFMRPRREGMQIDVHVGDQSENRQVQAEIYTQPRPRQIPGQKLKALPQSRKRYP